jgi:hypothetical protein
VQRIPTDLQRIPTDFDKNSIFSFLKSVGCKAVFSGKAFKRKDLKDFKNVRACALIVKK